MSGTIVVTASRLDDHRVADYAHPNYVDNAGLMGIILHEMGHLTSRGNQFNTQSLFYFNKEDVFGVEFPESVYFGNREAYVNDFARTLADGFDINVDQWITGEEGTGGRGFFWQSPKSLYDQRAGDGDNASLSASAFEAEEGAVPLDMHMSGSQEVQTLSSEVLIA